MLGSDSSQGCCFVFVASSALNVFSNLVSLAIVTWRWLERVWNCESDVNVDVETDLFPQDDARGFEHSS